MTTTPAQTLADDFVVFRMFSEFETALWAGELAHLEVWPDVTDAGLRSRHETLVSFSQRATELTTGSDGDRLLAETIAFTGRSQVVQMQWSPELRWVSPVMGIAPLIFTFLPRHTLIDDDHGERYLDKIRRFPEFARVWAGRLEQAAVMGITPSKHQVDSLLRGFERWLGVPLSKGGLGSQPAPQSFDQRHGELWTAALHATLDEVMAPAFVDLREVLANATLPRARPDEQPGLVYLEGGADLYEQLVWAHTTLDFSARQIHDIGLEQVGRLNDEYRQIAGPVLDTTNIDEIYQRLRNDPGLHYQEAHTLVDDAAAILARAAASIDGWFGITPKAPCTANAIEQGALAFYSRPARDGSQPGRFFFNTADPTIWGTFQLEAVTFHEGIPGHHLQLAIAQENPDLHPLLADYYVAAYNEGWGLYSERLADEMNLYTGPLDRTGMLSADSMRACRLVVDTGLHALGWSRDQAIGYMIDNSPMTRPQVEDEVDRYIGSPGQALGYMMGRLEIDSIRSRAERALAERFDIVSFHDTVLSTGSVPLATLSRVVDDWITSNSLQ